MDGEAQQILRSAHRSTQYQLLYKLSKNVEIFVTQNGMIGKSCQTCTHFEQLVQYLGDDCSTISWHASKLLYGLVELQSVCIDHLITLCVTQSALGRPLRSSVHLVLRLLQIQQPYDENSSFGEHPLSRILTNQVKSSDVMFSTICHFLIMCMEKDVIGGSKSLGCAISTLKPFISFVLLDNAHSLALLSHILDVSSILLPSFPCEVTSLITMIASNLSNQEMLKKNGTDLITVIQKLGIWYLDHNKSFQGSHLKWDILSLLITVCWNIVDKNENNKVYGALQMTKKLLDVGDDQSNGNGDVENTTKDELIFICAMLLLKVDESLATQVLQIIMLVLPTHLQSLQFEQLQALLSILVLPAVQLLYENKPVGLEGSMLLLDMGENLLRNIETFLCFKRCDTEQGIKPCVFKLVNTYSEIMNVAHSSMYKLHQLLIDKELAIAWCKDICKTHEFKRSFVVRENIILQLSSLLVCNFDEDVFKEALQAMVVICTRNCHFVNVFLPLLLYLLKSKRYEHVKLPILYCFPKIATGKTVISSILKVILSLSESYQLLPVCIMLMTTLWLEQPRIYPYLLQLLSKEKRKEAKSTKLWFDLLVARVTSILQVCKLMPTQHGEDMVVLISNIMEYIIQESQKDILFDEYASCLALLIEGLKALCISQVIDIRSIWKAVVAKVKVKNNRVVLQSLCSLLSCFPSLVGEGSHVFLEEVVAYLWSLVVHNDIAVVGSAYKALSVFPVEMMKIKFLPGKISEEICMQLRALKESKETNKQTKENEDEEEYDPKDEVCPGFGFMMLLHEISLDALPGFQSLLDAVLQHDVSNLPRGVGLRSFARPVASLYNQIPAILQSQYESSNRPAVLPGIAAGILCCFEPKIHGMDMANPSKSHLKLIMGRYKLMLENLLQEFTIRQNDWHQAILAPRSWTHFMAKLYDAFIKGHIADLNIQKEKGEIEDEESHKEEVESAKFWARDEILNQLRKASKGTPKLQGNSMFALAGLLNAAISYEEDEEFKIAAPDQYIPMRTWMLKVTDTLMTVFDGNFKPKGKPFQWCQQVSSERSTASSNLSRCCAAVTISELVQPLLSVDTNRIIQMVNLLKKASLGSQNSGSVTQFHFYCFIGWGLLLSRLSQEQFTELSGNDGRNAMLTSLTTLEEIVFNEQTNEHAGPVIGYGLAISSLLTHATQKDSKVHALLSYEKLLSKCTSFTKEDTVLLNNQAFCFALACTTMNAHAGGCISAGDVQTCAELIHGKMKKDSQSSDLHIALGVLCYAMLISNAKHVSDFISTIFEKWLQILTSDESPLLAKLGCIKGITAACGIDLLVFKLRDPDKFEEIPQVKDAVKLLQKLVVTCKDNSISYLAAQNLGQIYLINQVRSLGENSSIPQNYNYLKEMSLLRSVFNALLSAVSLGPHSDWNNIVVYSLVSSLCSLTDCRLPPVNWTVVLNPVLRIGYNLDVRKKCVKFAIKFVQQSSSLTRSVTSWIQPNFYLKMEDEMQKEFFATAPSYLTSLSNSEQRGLLELLPVTYLSHKNHKEVVGTDTLKSIMQLWSSVLQMQCSVQSSSAYIIAGMDKFVDFICSISEDVVIGCLSEFSKCLYLLMKDSWISVLSKLHCHPRLWCVLQIEMLKHVDCIQVENIVNVVLLGFQLEDVYVQHFLFQTLLELNTTRYDENTVKKVTQNLIAHEQCTKDSAEACNTILLLLMLCTPLDWHVLPYSSVSVECATKSVFTTVKSSILFTLQRWLAPDCIEKVQSMLFIE